jgi:predicted ATP-grasp superfamily ATP-dependent carboligase
MEAARAEPARGRRLRSLLGSPTAALVLGSDYRALGVVRSLGRKGVPVRVLAHGDDRLACFSRFNRGTVEWPRGDNERLTLLERLARADGHVWALFPSADESAEFVAHHHERLEGSLALTTPRWEVLRWAHDKRLTQELAVIAGVDYPLTLYPRSRQELERADLRFPLILKPAVKESLNALTAAKAWRADSREELLRRYDEAIGLVDRDVLMVQELVHGGGASQLSYAALAESGEVHYSLTAQRTRQYPPDFGRASTFVETIEAPALEDPSRRLIEASGFTGLVEIEYKVDTATGRMLLLDINPRVWGWHSLCFRAGVDFPWLLWAALRGDDLPPAVAQPGVTWLRLSTDLPTAFKEILSRRMGARPYVASLLRRHEGAIFARDDPRPGLVELPMLAATLVRRLRSDGPV